MKIFREIYQIEKRTGGGDSCLFAWAVFKFFAHKMNKV